MLHGKIEINGVEIGAWSATRKETIFKNTHRYNCDVEYRNLEGYRKTAEFPVVHYEPAGALALAAMVISTGLRQMDARKPKLNFGQDSKTV